MKNETKFQITRIITRKKNHHINIHMTYVNMHKIIFLDM